MEIDDIIDSLGGCAHVADLCGVTRAAVFQWRAIPPHHVILLAERSRLSPHEMRPDLYPHPHDGMHSIRARRRKARGMDSRPTS